MTESAAKQPEGVAPQVMRAWVAEARRRADEFATFLDEDLAASKLPESTGRTWEELRKRRLAELGAEYRCMSPSHEPRRARVEYTEQIEDQVAKLTASELHRLDCAVVAVSVDPEIGGPSRQPALREYRDEVEGVRIVYYETALRLIIVLAYVQL